MHDVIELERLNKKSVSHFLSFLGKKIFFTQDRKKSPNKQKNRETDTDRELSLKHLDRYENSRNLKSQEKKKGQTTNFFFYYSCHLHFYLFFYQSDFKSFFSYLCLSV